MAENYRYSLAVQKLLFVKKKTIILSVRLRSMVQYTLVMTDNSTLTLSFHRPVLKVRSNIHRSTISK